uniref:DOMON domain-containing protein n=1 Tax=Nelumbo nucifera TaxID=4432 RepID=A0A822XKP9_NELNU|nr:TPA_asm: hypothetical protein HUJ06_021756 [Nelumbo nucifera]
MTTVSSPMLFLCVLISLFFSSSAQTCQSYTFSSNRQFSSCSDLPVLNSYLHWTYSPSAGSVQIAYRHTGVTTSNWVAWAINPTSQGMIGAQALVAYQQSNGSMLAYTSPVTSVSTSLAEGNLSFQVSDLLATFDNNEMTIFATIELPNNLTTVNQVWQVGPVDQSTPRSHTTSGDNINSKGSLNFLSGQTTTTGNSVQRRRNVLALLLRPNKDHKYRFYWNIYHHSIGYSVIILSVINIFKGFDILQLGKNWKRAYIGIIVFLGFNFLMLEAITWNIVLKRRSRSSEKSHHGVNGVNGVNGYYGDRSQEVV